MSTSGRAFWAVVMFGATGFFGFACYELAADFFPHSLMALIPGALGVVTFIFGWLAVKEET